MRERDALRTAEAWLAEQDRQDTPDLTKMPQWHGRLSGEELAREFRACVFFAIFAIAVVLGFLSIGGM